MILEIMKIFNIFGNYICNDCLEFIYIVFDGDVRNIKNYKNIINFEKIWEI